MVSLPSIIPASFCTVGGLLLLRGGTEFRFRGGGEEGGARFSISAAGGEGGCQLGWRAHAGLKPASRRCEREIFLRSLALALNFLVRRARIACHRQPWSYPRRGTAGAPQRMSSRHTHFRNSLTKWRILPNLAGGRGAILDLGGGPRHPSPIVVCRGGGADPPRRL